MQLSNVGRDNLPAMSFQLAISIAGPQSLGGCLFPHGLIVEAMPTPEKQDKQLIMDLYALGGSLRVAADGALNPFKRLEDLGWAEGRSTKKAVLYTLTRAGVRAAKQLQRRRLA